MRLFDLLKFCSRESCYLLELPVLGCKSFGLLCWGSFFLVLRFFLLVLLFLKSLPREVSPFIILIFPLEVFSDDMEAGLTRDEGQMPAEEQHLLGVFLLQPSHAVIPGSRLLLWGPQVADTGNRSQHIQNH